MSSEAIKSLYWRTLTEVVYIRRYTGAGGPNLPSFDTLAHAQVTGFQPQELVGTIVVQGDRKAVVLFEDLVNGQFPLPVTVNDKLVVRGKELAILGVDDNTRREGATCFALVLQVRG